MSDVRIVVQVSEGAISDPEHQFAPTGNQTEAIFRVAAITSEQGNTDPHPQEDTAQALDFANRYLALPSHWRNHVRDAVNIAYEVQEDRAGIAWRETLNWVANFLEVADCTDAEVSEFFEMDVERVVKFRQVVELLRELAADTLAPLAPE